MPIDRSDNNRDEILSAERKRDELRKDREHSAKRAGQDFQSKLQTTMKSREEAQAKSTNKEELEKQEGIFSRIVAAYQKKEDGKDNQRKEDNKKDELDKERLREDQPEKSKLNADGDHKRIEASSDSNEGNEKGFGGGGQGSFSGGQKDSSSGGQGKSFSGFSQKETEMPNKKVSPVGARNFSDQGNKDSDQSKFPSKILNEIVDAVFVRKTDAGDVELELTLSDEYFSGLKFKVSNTNLGLVLTFVCPNRVVKTTFLFERPRIYDALMKKKLKVYRIDVF